MKKEEVWIFWIILWYILLPFIGLYSLITKPMKEMWDWTKVAYVLMLMITISLIGEFLENLL